MSRIIIREGIEKPELIARKTIEILQIAAIKSNNELITITSGIRSPYRQARAMYDNERKGNHIRYAAPGREVIAIYTANRTRSRDEVVKMMAERIVYLSKQGKRVSRHCVGEEEYKKLNIVDCRKFIKNPRDFAVALMDFREVVKVITPYYSSNYKDKRISVDTNEPAIHVEVRL